MKKLHWQWLLVSIAAILAIRAGLETAALNWADVALGNVWASEIMRSGIVKCGAYTSDLKVIPGLQSNSNRSVSVKMNLGRAFWLQGDCADAIDTWQAINHADPFNIDSIVNLLRAGSKPNIPQELLPEIADYTYKTGMFARAEAQTEASGIWLEISFSAMPQRKTANELARLYYDLGKFDDAKSVWKRMTQMTKPETAEYWWAIGKLAELDNDWQLAVAAYKSGVSLTADSYEFWMRQGYAFEQLKDWNGAERAYQSAISTNSRSEKPYIALGNIAEQTNNYTKAIQWYSQAEALAPASVDALYGLGHAYFAQGDDQVALTYLEKAMQAAPNSTWIAYYLAHSLYRSGKPEAGITYLQKAIEVYPGKPWTWALELGDWLQAFKMCKEADGAYANAEMWGADRSLIEEKRRALALVCQ